MILNSYIHEQLAAAHRRDLLEAAERDRLASRARHPSGVGEPSHLAFGFRRWRRRAALKPCVPSPSTATR